MAEGIERLRQFIGQLTGLLDGGADEARMIEQGGAAMRALVAADDWLPPESPSRIPSNIANTCCTAIRGNGFRWSALSGGRGSARRSMTTRCGG
jgi:3-mercaptopropionate dioxygenase